MKIFHISDLHIGKQLHLYNMLEDQRHILAQIVEKVKEYRPDVVVISGDVYDRSVPSGEAYQLFDEFLNLLAEVEPVVSVMIIAGNHDNAQRLQYAASFMEKQKIYISAKPPEFQDEYLKRVVLTDEHGEVNFYLCPFIKPGHIRHLFAEGEVTDYHTAYQKLLERENIDYGQRNVLVAHQFFVAGNKIPQLSDSEQHTVQLVGRIQKEQEGSGTKVENAAISDINVGGLDAVDASVVKAFDYVALGHIHGAQCVGAAHIRYSGTPLKYSVSEERHHKSITMVTIGEKSTPPVIETISLIPLRDVRLVKGTLEEIIRNCDEKTHDYVSITLTDEKELYRPKSVLEEYYSHILEVKVDNTRTRNIYSLLENTAAVDHQLTPMEAFREFYQLMQQQPMTETEENIILKLWMDDGKEE